MIAIIAKLLGFILVVLGGGALGRLIAGNYSRRTRQIAGLRTGLSLLATEIDYCSTPLPLALERVSRTMEQPVAEIFRSTGSALGLKGETLAVEAWEEALELIHPHTALGRRELRILRDLGPALGVSGRVDQLRHLNLAIERVKTEEDASRDEEGSGQRLWTSLGFLGGILLGILLL